jgi:hypothetical protein
VAFRDLCPHFPYGLRNLGLIFDPVHEGRQSHVECLGEQDDLLKRRARATALDPADIRRMNVSGARQLHDAQTTTPAQATDCLPEIVIRRHGSERDQAEGVQVPDARGHPDTRPLDMDHAIRREPRQRTPDLWGVEGLTEFGDGPPFRMSVCEQLHDNGPLHARQGTTIGLHRKVPPFGVTPPGC